MVYVAEPNRRQVWSRGLNQVRGRPRVGRFQRRVEEDIVARDIKQKVIETVESLPAEATIEDAMERFTSWRKFSVVSTRQMSATPSPTATLRGSSSATNSTP